MQSIDIDVWGADGRIVGITVRHPNTAITLQADRATRHAYREALRAGRPIESSVRSPEWAAKCDEIRAVLRVGLAELAQEGRPLHERRAIALELREHRRRLCELLERAGVSVTTAEEFAAAARFEVIVATCALDRETHRPVFRNADEYRRRADEPFSVRVATAVAKVLFGAQDHAEEEFLHQHPPGAAA